jgi:asparagine synthase (glutamine-hydrolysing)
MTRAIAHRGPDAEGAWIDPQAGIALGHRRLSIIDLSPAGSQPMTSADGRLVIAYNGEIYNFAELRRELERCGRAPLWKGHSDTEVLLAAIAAWGVRETLRRVVGMFAFALWDRQGKILTLARDRMGEKPLYYGWQGHGEARCFLFGSDLSALSAHPAFEAQVDPEAIELLLRVLYIPEPRSVYRGIAKLCPGSILTLQLATGDQRLDAYWNTLEVAARARAEPFDGSPGEAVDALDEILGRAVERQMVSDVPIGAFLSGGIDSSAIVALMQRFSRKPVKTFTIGFGESEFNEAPHARAVAAHLGTDHTELILRASDAQDVIPKLHEMYSEPFADSSQVPTYLVSRLARQHVTVSLSGDAGDELFGGYNRHVYAHRRWPLIARIPRALREHAKRMLLAVPPSAWDRAAGLLLSNGVPFVGDKMHRAADVIASESPHELYANLITINPTAGELMLEPHRRPFDGVDLPLMEGWSVAERIMALDAVRFLPGDILVKLDRAAMDVSLETRIPMLDPSVLRLCWSLPIDYKIRDGVSKWPLRQLLHRYVPAELVDRPKMGFRMPLGNWLRGPLRDWAESLLAPDLIRQSGLFRPEAVDRLWLQHLQGSRNNEHRLWPLLMVQAWLQHQGRNTRLACSSAGVAASNESTAMRQAG